MNTKVLLRISLVAFSKDNIPRERVVKWSKSSE